MRKLTLVALTLFFTNSSFGNLQVYPTRLFLSPRSKTGTISIKLKTDEPMTYRVSTMFYEMLPDGSMKQRPDLARSEESAKKYLRYSPKRISLKPGVEQVVRISARRFKSMSRKEVRTHLYFRPEEKTPNKNKKNKLTKKESAFDLRAQVAVAIPIIVSSEPSEKPHSIENFKLFTENGTNYFSFNLVNNSERYLYGDIKVYKNNSGDRKLLTEVKGISSYIPKRLIKFSLTELNKGSIPNGEYLAEFNEYSSVKKEEGKITKAQFIKK